MPKMVFDEWYGEMTFALRTQVKQKNVPPALYEELLDYFGGNYTAMTAYLKQKQRSGLNYGEVYRDSPDVSTGTIPANAWN